MSIMNKKLEVCGTCGQEYGIGEYPFCPHGVPMGMGPNFKAYRDDFNFPESIEVTSLAQKHTLEKMHGLVEREPPKKGDLSARVDRCMQIRQERERHAMDA